MAVAALPRTQDSRRQTVLLTASTLLGALGLILVAFSLSKRSTIADQNGK